MNKLYRTYEQSARKRGYAWRLSKRRFGVIVRRNCHYCGAPPSRKTSNPTGKQLVFNGIDRMSNTRGYITKNVVTCCWECNVLKARFGYVDFLGLVARVYEHRISAHVQRRLRARPRLRLLAGYDLNAKAAA